MVFYAHKQWDSEFLFEVRWTLFYINLKNFPSFLSVSVVDSFQTSLLVSLSIFKFQVNECSRTMFSDLFCSLPNLARSKVEISSTADDFQFISPALNFCLIYTTDSIRKYNQRFRLNIS